MHSQNNHNRHSLESLVALLSPPSALVEHVKQCDINDWVAQEQLLHSLLSSELLNQRKPPAQYLKKALIRILDTIESQVKTASDVGMSDQLAVLRAALAGFQVETFLAELDASWSPLCRHACEASLHSHEEASIGYQSFSQLQCIARCASAGDCTNQSATHIYHADDGLKLNQCISLRVSSLFSEIGKRVWRASISLAKVAACHPRYFRNANVLELGAGTGVAGLLIAAAVPDIHSLSLTDMPLEVENLQHNVDANRTSSLLQSIQVLALEWGEATAEIQSLQEQQSITEHVSASTGVQRLLNADVVLGSDLIYSPDIASSLANMLGALAKYRRSLPLTLLATTLRNPETFAVFEETAKKNNLVVHDVTDQLKYCADIKHTNAICPERMFSDIPAVIKILEIRLS